MSKYLRAVLLWFLTELRVLASHQLQYLGPEARRIACQGIADQLRAARRNSPVSRPDLTQQLLIVPGSVPDVEPHVLGPDRTAFHQNGGLLKVSTEAIADAWYNFFKPLETRAVVGPHQEHAHVDRASEEEGGITERGCLVLERWIHVLDLCVKWTIQDNSKRAIKCTP